METVQIQLPVTLAQQIQQTKPSDKTVEQIFTEAVQLWLNVQQQKIIKTEAEKTLQFLRQSGLVMSQERQSAFAQSVKATLETNEKPDRVEVEAALANFTPPLSEEIIAMREE